MSFLQLGLLWALPLALLPVVIHLLNRLRYRTVHWGAMMFLERANKSSTHMNRVRQWLILLLRVLALLALILCLARPLLGGWLGFSLAGPPDTVILLLDRSASMNAHAPSGGTRLDQAVAAVARAAETFGSSSRFVLIDSATGKASQVPAIGLLNELPAATRHRHRRKFALHDVGGGGLPERQQNRRRGDLDRLRLAGFLVAGRHAGLGARWRPASKRLPSAPRIRLLAMDTPAAGDLSLSLVSARTAEVNGKYQHELTFHIRQSASEASEKTLTLFDGVNQYPVKIKVAGTLGRYRHTFETDISDKPTLGFLELPADSNPGNNGFYFGLGQPAPRHTLVIGRTDDAAAQISLLAAAPDNAAGEEATILACRILPPRRPARRCHCWSGPRRNLPPKSASRWRPSSKTAAPWSWHPPSDTLGTGKWGDWLVWGTPETAPDKRPWRVSQWEKADGPFADTDSGDPLSLDKLAALKRVAFSGKGIPLGFYADGQPFAMRFKSGGGSTIVLSTSLHPAWSNLGMGTVAVPMMQRLIDEGAKRLAPCLHRAVGAALPGDGSEVTRLLPRQEAHAFTDPRTQAGIYQAGASRFSLNRPEAEDEALCALPAEASGVMKDVPLRVFADAASDGQESHSEIWKHLLLLMLMLLAFETFLIMPAKPATPKGTGL